MVIRKPLRDALPSRSKGRRQLSLQEKAHEQPDPQSDSFNRRNVERPLTTAIEPEVLEPEGFPPTQRSTTIPLPDQNPVPTFRRYNSAPNLEMYEYNRLPHLSALRVLE